MHIYPPTRSGPGRAERRLWVPVAAVGRSGSLQMDMSDVDDDLVQGYLPSVRAPWAADEVGASGADDS